MVREDARSTDRDSRRFRWLPFDESTIRDHVSRGPGKQDPSADADGFLGRIAMLGVAAFLFATGFKLSGAQSQELGWVLVELLLYASAIGFTFGAVLAREWSKRAQTLVAVALGLAIVFSVSYEILVLHQGYSTDVLAFAHGGAEMLLDGQNPYEATPAEVERITARFGIIPTPTESGDPIDWLISYPALHVLIFTFFVGVEVVDLRWALLVVELLTLGVIWRYLSPRARLVAPFVLLLAPYLSVIFTGGGVTDWLWVLPLVGTIVSMRRGNFGWAGLFLGLACAVKQHPWFAVPFVMIWVIQSLRRAGVQGTGVRETALRFTGALAAGFVIPNLPFILWSPTSWFESVVSPALSGLSGSGHGLVVLTVRGVLDIPPAVHAILMAVAMLTLLWLYARWFNRLKDTLWLMPMVLIFLSHRALHSYFVFWIPVVVVWLDQAGEFGTSDSRSTLQVTG
jgi:uncharacterized membrane protein